MILTRKMLEEREAQRLAGYANFSSKSKGRFHEEDRDEDERLCFQKDVDRVVHSKAFRRMEEKTQVFRAGSGDHYRTRLTHSIEVAHIGRDVARRMGLNEDLAAAICLAHDLGHPPFAHGGQDALDEIMRSYGGHFEHNEQSRRVVEVLERQYPDFEGLNLTKETLEGLMKHQTAYDQAGKEFEKAAHLEGQVANIADEIAYTNHDMDDGLRSGLITVDELRQFELWKQGEEDVVRKYGELEGEIFVRRVISTIISLMVEDLCQMTEHNLKENGIRTLEDVVNFQGQLMHFSEGMRSMIGGMRKHLYDNFYMHPDIVEGVDRGKMMIKELFDFYMNNKEQLPVTFLREGDALEINVKDYIAGMTDGFLVEEFEKQLGKR